jgi:hypothetical protein
MLSHGPIACFLQAYFAFMLIKQTDSMGLRASRVYSYTTKESSSTTGSWSYAENSTYSRTTSNSAGTVQVNTPSLVLQKDHIVTDIPQVRQYDWVVE